MSGPAALLSRGELTRTKGRFGAVVGALALIVFLVLVLGALADGLFYGATGAVRSTNATAYAFSDDAEGSLIRSRMDELDNLKRQDCDLVEIAKQSIKDVAVTNQKVSFRLATKQESLILSLDHDRIKQVLTNLLANASRFAPDSSEVTLEINAEGEKVILKVVDRGDGIDDSLKEKVFDRFYRADNSRNRETGGSGLGLAIAKSIVEAHEGRIWVEDTMGGGATFVVELGK